MIKFSWKKINDKFGWNAYSVLEYLFLARGIKPPPYLRSKIPENVKKEAKRPADPGPCFILNLDKALLEAKNPNDLYMYLELASRRNIFDYLIRGILYLPIVLVPEYLKEWIYVNPMLEIEKDNVYFKYEQEKTI